MQGIAGLLVAAFNIFRPAALVHAAIGPAVYPAYSIDGDVKRIAGKLKF